MTAYQQKNVAQVKISCMNAAKKASKRDLQSANEFQPYIRLQSYQCTKFNKTQQANSVSVTIHTFMMVAKNSGINFWTCNKIV